MINNHVRKQNNEVFFIILLLVISFCMSCTVRGEVDGICLKVSELNFDFWLNTYQNMYVYLIIL